MPDEAQARLRRLHARAIGRLRWQMRQSVIAAWVHGLLSGLVLAGVVAGLWR